MGRHKADAVTRDLLGARREAIKRMYFEMGSERSFSKLQPFVTEKFGGPSRRVIQGWSASEHWPELAARYDVERAATTLRQSEEVLAAGDVDEAITLRLVVQMHLKQIVSQTLSLAEKKVAMGIVESALRALGELTGGARRRTPMTTTTNNTLIVGDGGPARRALAALGDRMAALDVRPAPAQAPATSPVEQKPAGRVLDLDALQAHADATGRPFEELLNEWDQETSAVPLAPLAPAAAPDQPEVYVDVRDLARDAAATGKSFAALIAERKQ
jgi:hypothetical protein